MQVKLKIIVAILLLLCVAGIIVVIATKASKDEDLAGGEFPEGTIVRENVSVITEDTEKSLQPIRVNEESLVFNADPKYAKDEIVVAGIIDSAPYGFIRRVVETVKEDNQYIVFTEAGVLTDVFEEAHIVKYFALSEEAAEELTANNLGYKGEETYTAESLQYNGNVDKAQMQNLSFFKLEGETESGVSLEGKVSVDIWLELKIDIVPITKAESSIDFGIILHKKVEGAVDIGYKAGAKAEFEKTLFEKESTKCFSVGGIPIVVTNSIEANFEGKALIEGSIGINYSIEAETSSGFLYHGQTNKVEEINEKSFQSDGLGWNTKSMAKGQTSAGVFSHLITKLYDSTGTDFSVGIEGKVEGEVSVSPNKSYDGLNYAGDLSLSIGPKIEGKLIVSVPIIDKVLAEKTIFTVSLPPWWEKRWISDEAEDRGETAYNGNNTYITRFSDVNAVTYPHFTFDYPSNWAIIEEYVTYDQELVTLENDRGFEIIYSHLGTGDVGGFGNTVMMKMMITKVGDSSFVPSYVQDNDHSDLGKFMVAKIKVIGELFMQTDSDYTEVDGAVFYAVLPESCIGIREGVRDMTSIVEFSFDYSAHIAFICKSPDGSFTVEEEREAIAILSSFR